ncbi:alcohol oxidase-like protein [Crucibulum laeve]|uniref:pyranose dehydrogenase (acceptor) n=1 Tax=Crucibulum laeve TaxID=68775 RepID=A0A5C3M692_9AGAR|nr:alcohol oxidase-like protein [Crucibulum laeve]
MASMATDIEYDIVFAGGGASGCLIAGRLAAADPSLKILILEAGEHTLNLPAHTQPVRFFTHLQPGSTTVSFNVSKPSPYVNGRSIVTPSGRCLGGGSSVNFTMYTRAAASDYDDWETKFGNEGWSSRELIPLLKKTETYEVTPNLPTHGYSGPLKVSFGGAYTNIGKQFLEAATTYDKTRGFTEDINGLVKCNEYGRWEKWIDSETGHRSDVPHHFIYNQTENKNLHIMTGKRVKRVIFEGDRAVGVEYVNDTTINPDTEQTVHIARAAKLVVISAGAFGSPTILERSGIGSADILQRVGVEVKADLPGVGENYQDHNVLFVPYLASEDAETLDGLFSGDKDAEEENLKLYEHGKGFIAHNGLDAGIKMRPNEEDLKILGPAFEERWKTFFADAPDKPVVWIGTVSGYLGDHSIAPLRKYYSVGFFNEYPASMGNVHIKSADDANAPHDFDANFLSDPADLVILKWGYKKSREFARRMGVFRGEYLPAHPPFSESGEAKGIKDASQPVDASKPDVFYEDEDERILEEYLRNYTQTSWHSLGTCAMKPRSQGGVVDDQLDVYGVNGLKVADLDLSSKCGCQHL